MFKIFDFDLYGKEILPVYIDSHVFGKPFFKKFRNSINLLSINDRKEMNENQSLKIHINAYIIRLQMLCYVNFYNLVHNQGIQNPTLGAAAMYVGVLWTIVTCSTVSLMFGNNVTEVAPDPTKATLAPF